LINSHPDAMHHSAVESAQLSGHKIRQPENVFAQPRQCETNRELNFLRSLALIYYQ
jgi:hypothetical protein